MTDIDPDIDTRTPIDRYITALAAAKNANDPGIAKLIRWTPAGRVDIDVLRITAAAEDDQWAAWALAGKLFARWHSGRSTVRYGKAGTGLGHALRTIGSPGARGPRDPGAVRLLDRLISANTDAALADVIDAVGRRLRAVEYPPNWATVAAEIEAWRNPLTRNDVQIMWARQFHTYQPAGAAAVDES